MKIEKECEECGEKMIINESVIKYGRGKFCSKKCSRKHYKENHPLLGRIGKKSANYKGGYILRSGSGNIEYREVQINGKKSLEHRLIMSKHLERDLLKEEVVHHIDGNGLNNNIINLKVMTRGEHTKLHAQIRGGGAK